MEATELCRRADKDMNGGIFSLMQTSGIIFLLSGLIAGAVAAWMLAKSHAQSGLAVFQERLLGRDRELADLALRLAQRDDALGQERSACSAAQAEVAGLKAQIARDHIATEDKLNALIAVENNLKQSFDALAASALDANSQRLLQLNSQELEKQQSSANHQLASKQSAIEAMLGPMKESLAKLTHQSHELEVKREGAYTAVLAEIQGIQRSHLELRRETTQLVQALRAPKARGNWGELHLRRCVEFAGMLQYASFDVEKFVRGEDANYRPDLVVKLPNGRTIIVDAKTPLDAFLDASTAEEEIARAAKLVAHAARVRKHLEELSSKAYWRQFVDSPDFIVCFLPSEVLFSAALEQDPSLIEYSASAGVLLATPTTLIALLKAVAFGWQQAEIAKNATAIRDTALTVYAKLAGLHADFVDLGKRLKSAGSAYDDMLTKVEGRGGIFSISRKLRELKIGEKDLPELTPIALATKPLTGEDWQPSLSLAASAEQDKN